MKLSDFKGEDALDVLADIIEPVTDIATDTDVTDQWKSKGKMASLVKVILKKHPKGVIAILARLENKSYEEYAETINIATLPAKLLEVMQDEVLMSFFLR